MDLLHIHDNLTFNFHDLPLGGCMSKRTPHNTCAPLRCRRSCLTLYEPEPPKRTAAAILINSLMKPKAIPSWSTPPLRSTRSLTKLHYLIWLWLKPAVQFFFKEMSFSIWRIKERNQSPLKYLAFIFESRKAFQIYKGANKASEMERIHWKLPQFIKHCKALFLFFSWGLLIFFMTEISVKLLEQYVRQPRAVQWEQLQHVHGKTPERHQFYQIITGYVGEHGLQAASGGRKGKGFGALHRSPKIPFTHCWHPQLKVKLLPTVTHYKVPRAISLCVWVWDRKNREREFLASVKRG